MGLSLATRVANAERRWRASYIQAEAERYGLDATHLRCMHLRIRLLTGGMSEQQADLGWTVGRLRELLARVRAGHELDDLAEGDDAGA